MQLGDKKAQCGKLFRDFFEVIGLRREARFGETLDLACAFAQHLIRTVLTQHHQRTLDLADRLRQRRQRGLARGVAEIGIQGRFDGPEVGADFARHRFEQQAFLRPARHGVEVRQVHHAEFFAASDGDEAIDDGIRGVHELGIQRLEIFQCGFGEQQCGGDFQRHALVVPGRVAAQLVGLLEYGRGQPRVIRLRGGGALFGDLRDALVKRRQRGDGAGAKPVPVILGGRQQFTQAAHDGQQSLGLGGRCGGHHAVQAVGGTHDGQGFAAGGGTGRQIKRLAQLLLVRFGAGL